MNLNLYDLSVPVFQYYLAQLSHVLDKAAHHATDKAIPECALLQARLYPDMAPLINQIRTADDFARRTCAPLAGVDIPSYPYTEQTFAELKNRIARTLAFLASLKPADMNGHEDRAITTHAGQATKHFSGLEYLNLYALPNFYFHYTSAYAILRHNGIAIGKGDFDGHHLYAAQ